MEAIRLTSLQAPNQDFIIQGLGVCLSQQLGIPVEAELNLPWQEREKLLDEGRIQIAWVCGLGYIQRADRADSNVDLLAAPVMEAARYQNRPVYFSDLLVRRESPYQQFSDLRGARWAYNEPNSHSGYNITRFTIAQLDHSSRFFGEVTQAGSHQRAIAMLLDNQIDAAAIDSTVLALEMVQNQRIGTELRVIGSLGPSPIPPLIIDRRLPFVLRREIQGAVLRLHTTHAGRSVLQAGGIKHYTPVSDRDYNPIREMARLAAGVRL